MPLRNFIPNIFLFTFLSLLPVNVSLAQTTFASDDACVKAGGLCNNGGLGDNNCAENQTKLGLCTSALLNNTACCQAKETSLTINTIPKLSPGDAVVPIVGEKNCTAAKGICKSKSVFSFSSSSPACDTGTENFAGACSLTTSTLNAIVSGDASLRRFDCCVAKNVTSVPSASQYVTTDKCSSLGGRSVAINKDPVDAVGDLAGLVVGSSTCKEDNPDSVFLGYTGTYGGDNVCCIAKNSPLGQSISSGGGVSGGEIGTNETPFQYGDYTLLEPLPGAGNDSGDLPTYLQTLYQVILVLVVLGAVMMLTWGGFLYMTAAANTSILKKAKGIITDALFGLIIALSAWLILNIINPDLVNVTLNGLSPVEINNPTLGAGSGAAGSGGGSASAIISAAHRKVDSSCEYSMAKRNNCQGSPGYTDCSNFTQNAYKEAGCRDVGPNTATMWPRAEDIGDTSSLQPGDALVIPAGRRGAGKPGHVVICENVGCSKITEAMGKGLRKNTPNYMFQYNPKVLKASKYCG